MLQSDKAQGQKIPITGIFLKAQKVFFLNQLQRPKYLADDYEAKNIGQAWKMFHDDKEKKS